MLRGIAAVLAVVAMSAGSAVGAHLDVHAQVVAAYERATFTPVQLPDVSGPVGVELIYEIELSFEISDLGGPHPLGGTQEGFAGLSMDLLRANIGVPTEFFVGYEGGEHLTIDVQPPHNWVIHLWLINEDAGPDNLDLLDIVAVVSGGTWHGAADPRLQMGQSAPKYFGTAYVTWDGLTPASLTVDVTAFGTLNADGLAATDPDGTAWGDTIYFVPGPTTLSLLGAGAVALLRRKRWSCGA